jgi:hypothetical protein
MTSSGNARGSWDLASSSSKYPNPQEKICNEGSYLRAHLTVLSGRGKNSTMGRLYVLVTDVLTNIGRRGRALASDRD